MSKSLKKFTIDMGHPKHTGKTYQLRRVNQNQNKQNSNNAGSSSAMNTYDKLIDSDSEETSRITSELKPAAGNIKKKQQKQTNNSLVHNLKTLLFQILSFLPRPKLQNK